jgi:hypothetical protein
LEQLDDLSREDLIRIIIEPRRVNERLQAEIEQLKRRGGAAPFSKRQAETGSKAAGTEAGSGIFPFSCCSGVDDRQVSR